MQIIKTLGLAAALALAASPAFASARCKVTDPTGTPLNVRTTDGDVIDTLSNGRTVHIMRYGHDRRGKPWAYVDYGSGEGWVYREFISCY